MRSTLTFAIALGLVSAAPLATADHHMKGETKAGAKADMKKDGAKADMKADGKADAGMKAPAAKNDMKKDEKKTSK